MIGRTRSSSSSSTKINRKVSEVIDLYKHNANADTIYYINGVISKISSFKCKDDAFDVFIIFDDGVELTRIKLSSELTSTILDINPRDYITFKKFMNAGDYQKYRDDFLSKLQQLLCGPIPVKLFSRKPTIILEIFKHDISTNIYSEIGTKKESSPSSSSPSTTTTSVTKRQKINSTNLNDSKDSNDSSFIQRVTEYELTTFDVKVTDSIDDITTVMNLVNQTSSNINADSDIMIGNLNIENSDKNYGYFIFSPQFDKLVLVHPKE